MSQPATTRLDAAGVQLAADRYGDPANAPVVLLHGGGQTRHAWGSAGLALANAGRWAISLDLRGHGDSDWSPDGVYSIRRLGDDVLAVVASLERRPTLVGASLGGLAALVAIGESAAPIATALVLVDVTPRVESGGSERNLGFMRGGMRGFDSLDAAADAIATFNVQRQRPRSVDGLRKNLRQQGDGRWYWHWDPRFLTNIDGFEGREGQVNSDRMRAAARNVSVPTLLVRGRMSDIVSDEGVAELRELIPHAEVVDVAGAGHMVAGDKNDVFNDAVVDFVARHT